MSPLLGPGAAPSWRARWAVLSVCWGALFVATHIPNPSALAPAVSDKWMHLGAYGGLGVLWMWAQRGRGVGLGRAAARVLVGLALYGVVDEVSQGWVGRSCDARDWAADVGGALLAVLGWWAAEGAERRWVGRSARPG